MSNREGNVIASSFRQASKVGILTNRETFWRFASVVEAVSERSESASTSIQTTPAIGFELLNSDAFWRRSTKMSKLSPISVGLDLRISGPSKLPVWICGNTTTNHQNTGPVAQIRAYSRTQSLKSRRSTSKTRLAKTDNLAGAGA